MSWPPYLTPTWNVKNVKSFEEKIQKIVSGNPSPYSHGIYSTVELVEQQLIRLNFLKIKGAVEIFFKIHMLVAVNQHKQCAPVLGIENQNNFHFENFMKVKSSA